MSWKQIASCNRLASFFCPFQNIIAVINLFVWPYTESLYKFSHYTQIDGFSFCIQKNIWKNLVIFSLFRTWKQKGLSIIFTFSCRLTCWFWQLYNFDTQRERGKMNEREIKREPSFCVQERNKYDCDSYGEFYLVLTADEFSTQFEM